MSGKANITSDFRYAKTHSVISKKFQKIYKNIRNLPLEKKFVFLFFQINFSKFVTSQTQFYILQPDKKKPSVLIQ